MSTKDRTQKNQSMNSTHHMTCNQSFASNLFSQKRPQTTALLSYANIPIPKQSPRWNQSAATWRHTSHKHSFSKDNRFKDYTVNYSDIIQPQIPTSITSKSCTFGKGTKKPISIVVLRNAKQKPAPDRYEMKSFDQSTRQTSRGKSFGIGWKNYQKVFLNHRKDAYSPFHTEDNPPAKYQVRQSPGKDANKFTAYGRLKMYTQKIAESKTWVPGPHHEVKDRHLYGTVGLNDRNFSFGERIDFAKPANHNPQAIYNIPGFCDRFTNLKKRDPVTSR